MQTEVSGIDHLGNPYFCPLDENARLKTFCPLWGPLTHADRPLRVALMEAYEGRSTRRGG